MTPRVVLDTSAVLAMLLLEPGGDIVANVIGRACLSSVNLCETVGKLIENAYPPGAAIKTVEMLRFEIIGIDRDLAVAAAFLRGPTRANGLSLGDRMCLALGQKLNATVLTADQAWGKLDLGIDVRVIR
jgi:ribonuclease VapC